jgi:hypothetical protein
VSNKPQFSQYKTFDSGISFEKPFVDPVDLKPKFREKLFAAGRNFGSIEDARQFAKDLLHACQKAEEIKHRFECYANDENALHKIVKEYEHQH